MVINQRLKESLDHKGFFALRIFETVLYLFMIYLYFICINLYDNESLFDNLSGRVGLLNIVGPWQLVHLTPLSWPAKMQMVCCE